MSSYLGPLTAGFVFILGYWLYGWRGLVLGATILVFWLLMQFHRALKVMRRASQRPVGLVDSAVMLQSRLKLGLNLQEVITLAGSLGQKVEGETDDWRWHDNAGHEVMVCLRRGRVVRWYFARGDGAEPDGARHHAGTAPPAPHAAANATADPAVAETLPPPDDLLYRPGSADAAPDDATEAATGAPGTATASAPAGPRN